VVRGDLVLEKSLDYELRSEYEMRIMVRQEETRDVISVRVRVSNVNDWSPTFRCQHHDLKICEIILSFCPDILSISSVLTLRHQRMVTRSDQWRSGMETLMMW